jgi:hypothetical protein
MSTPIHELLSPKNKEISSFLIPKTPKSKKTQRSTNDLADRLVEKFKSPEFRPLFLKVAWRLDDGTIDKHLATAFELGKNPRALFITLVKQEKAYYE